MRPLLFLALWIWCALPLAFSQDTFSILAVDPETGEVGSAGASCVTGIVAFGGVMLLSGIVPGRGGVNAQAYICIDPHIKLDNAIARIGEGNTPEEGIDWPPAEEFIVPGDLRVFPNPVHSTAKLTIAYELSAESGWLEWHTAAGQRVERHELQQSQTSFTAPAQPGLYWVSLHDSSGNVLQRGKIIVF